MPEAAIQMPDVTADDPVASFLSPEERQEDVNGEIAIETGADETVSDVTTGYGRDGFRYESALDMTGQPLVLQQVLNNEKTLDDLNEGEQIRLGQELTTVMMMQGVLSEAAGTELETAADVESTLNKVLSGELSIGDADRTALRNISLQLGNLYSIPPTLANGMRQWTMNENRDVGSGPLQAMVAENFAARQAESARVNIGDKVVLNGGDTPVMGRDDINDAMTKGPDNSQFSYGMAV